MVHLVLVAEKADIARLAILVVQFANQVHILKRNRHLAQNVLKEHILEKDMVHVLRVAMANILQKDLLRVWVAESICIKILLENV
jgi:N-acetylglutamate synthase-like GNAT family acetyltransferase